MPQAVGILAAILVTLFMGCVYLQWNGQVTLFLCAVLTAVFARLKGYLVEEIENMILEGIRVVAIALVINICIVFFLLFYDGV